MFAHLRRMLSMRVLVTFMLFMGMAGESLGFGLAGTPPLWAIALGAGLLASTFGIDLEAMRASDWRVVVKSVTIGVLKKSLIIGGSMALATLHPSFLVIGFVVAQMDPVAMSALMSKGRMTPRAESISRAVSSLDDPFTVLLTILAVLAQRAFNFDLGLDLVVQGVESPGDYGKYMWLNVAFMTFVVFVWQLAYRGSQTWRLVFTLSILAGSVVVGADWYWMFGLALIGIYLRPAGEVYAKVNNVLEFAAKAAFAVTGVVAGSVLFTSWENGAALDSVGWGVMLGTVAFFSQVIVGPLMMLGGDYSRQDRWYFACAHQNGLTALILGVSLGLVPLIVPAIIVTHILHAASMWLLDRHFADAQAA
jgi:hypothetical protein